MHGVRGVADQGEAARRGGLGELQRQRIGPTRADDAEASQKIAEAAPQFGQEPVVVEGHEGGRQIGALGPHDGGAIARNGQDGEGPGRQEVLVGDEAVGPFVLDRAHDAALFV